jgi:hypothetical protein
MAFLTMEASPRGYAIWNPRLVAPFPCNSACSSPCCTLPSKDSEAPWKSSNLSPKPVPNVALARTSRWGSASVALEPVGAPVVSSGPCHIKQPG